MDIVRFDKDITIMYVTAPSFPDRVMEAFEKLHSLVPFSTKRKFLSVSRPERTTVIYRAGAEEMYAGEAKKLGLETLILKSGNYLCITINDFMNDISAIGKAFEKLLNQPGLDPQGYCVEWYYNEKDVKCMIRLEQ